MRDQERNLTLAALALGICVGSTAAGEYRDPAGFSFTYPEGWVPVTSREALADTTGLPPEIKAWLDKNHVDFTKLSVALVREGDDEAREYMNVGVNPGQLAVNQSNLKDLLKLLPEKYREMGVKIENIGGRMHK